VRDEPPEAARRYPGDVPPDAVAVGELLLFALQKTHQSRADMAQSDDAEVVGANADLPV